MDEPKNVKFKANEITKSIQWKQLESIGTSRPSTAHTIYRTKTPLPKLVSRPTTGKSIQSRPETAYIESRPQTPHLSRLFQRQEQLERTARAYSAKERLVVSSTRFIRNIPVLDLLMTPAELLLGKESLPTVPRNSLQLDPLAVRFIEQDQKTDHRGKVFLIMNGRIIKEEVAFQLFLDSICEESWPLAMHIISFIETISKHYHVPWAECRHDRLHEIMNDFNAVQRTRTIYDYAYLMMNQDQVISVLRKPGRRYQGPGKRNAAAKKIQATWKMHVQREHYLHWKDKLKAGMQIVKCWNRKMARRWRLTMDQKRLENAIEYIREKTIEFASQWDEKYQGPRTVIMINSLGFEFESRVEAQDSMEYLQTFSYARLLELADENVSVIYITPKLSPDSYQAFEKFLSHHFDLQQLLDSGRLIIIQVPKPSYIVKSVCLTSSVLIQTNIVKQLKKLVQNKVCYLESLVTGPDDAKLCHQLNIPAFGNFDQNAFMSLNRYVTRQFISNCNQSEMHGIVVKPNCIPFIFQSKIRQIMKENPKFSRFLLKMNNQMNGKGLAYFDAFQVRKVGNDEIEDVITLVKPDLWHQKTDYFAKFRLYGGVIEAVPDDEWEIKYPIVAIRIFPNGTTNIVGTGDLFALKPFQDAGIATPQQSCISSVVKSLAIEFANELVKEGYYGILTSEFISWKEPNETDYNVKTLSAKPYYTQAYNFIQMIQYGARSLQLWNDQLSHVISPKQIPQFSHLKRLRYYDQSKIPKSIPSISSMRRAGIAIWGLHHDSVPYLSHQALEGLCAENGLFLNEDGTGAMIPTYSVQDKSPLIMIQIHTSMEKAILETLAAFVKLSRTLTTQIPHNFLDYAKLLIRYLESNFPDYEPNPFPNPQTDIELEKYVARHINDPSMFMPDLKKEKQKAPLQFSHEAIKLLTMDIPSQALKSDITYGKIQLIKPNIFPNRIPQGTSPEEYLKILDKKAAEKIPIPVLSALPKSRK